MATVLSQSSVRASLTSLPTPANNDDTDFHALTADHRIIAWLFRSTKANEKAMRDRESMDLAQSILSKHASAGPDDWQIIATLCGHAEQDFTDLGLGLPLSSAEIDHFRRNHRGADHFVGRDFLTAKIDLPSPLAELYSLYRHRARLDAEAALFVAQTTNSTRVACVMADLLAVGGFAQGHECIAHMMTNYAVPVAFDTSDVIDHANREAKRRLSLPADHPAHLLKLSPDEISILASNIVGKHVLSAHDFIEKANALAIARQDVNRIPSKLQFLTAIREGDLQMNTPWVARLCVAYSRIFRGWFVNTPEFSALLGMTP